MTLADNCFFQAPFGQWKGNMFFKSRMLSADTSGIDHLLKMMF